MSGNVLNTTMTSILGGGLPGGQPKWGLIGGGAGPTGGSGMEGGGARGVDRFVLREAFGNQYLSNNNPVVQSPAYYVNQGLSKTTPFRAIMSAGDVNGSKNQAGAPFLPSPNQVRPSYVQTVKMFTNGVQDNGTSYFTGNPRYVYDGSDYVRYKKLRAVNKTYDDKSFGGANNGAYSALKRVRRF
jgi:hypothetical protein